MHIGESVKLHLSFILLPRPRLPTSFRSIEKGGCSRKGSEDDIDKGCCSLIMSSEMNVL